MQVPARSWMRAAQLAWYTVVAAANLYSAACAAASLQHMLRTHAQHAASDRRSRTAPRPICGRHAAAASAGDVHEPLLDPASTRGGPSSSSTQQPAQGPAFLGAPRDHSIHVPPAPRPPPVVAGLPARVSLADLKRLKHSPPPPSRPLDCASLVPSSVRMAIRWPTRVPSSEMLPGRPKAHAYCTLPAPTSELHAYRPSPALPLASQVEHSGALLATSPRPERPPCGQSDAAARRSTASDVGCLHEGHASVHERQPLPWLPGWGLCLMPMGEGCPRAVAWVWYAVYVCMGCIHVWAVHQVAVWNGVSG